MKMQRLVTFLWYLFVAVLPWQTVWLWREVWIDGEKWQYGTVGVYLSEVVLVGLIGVLISQNACVIRKDILRKVRKFRSGQYWRRLISAVFVVSFVLFVFVSALWATDWILSVYYGVKVLLVVALIYLARFARIDLARTAQVFVGSLTIGALIGIWQFVAQDTFASTFLGISKLNAFAGGVSVIEVFGEYSGRYLRAYGPQAHPNIFGALSAIGVVLAVGFALSCRRATRILFTFCAIVLTVGVMTSFSRSALITLVISLIMLGVVVFNLRKKFVFLYGVIIIILLIVAGGFYLQYNELYDTRLAGETRLEQKSLDERVGQVSQAIDIFAQNLLVGVGAGNYTLELATRDKFAQPIWRYQPVHNTDLLMLAELGIIGIVLFVGAILIFLRKVFAQKLSWQQAVFATALLAFVITAIFDHWQWSSFVGLAIFGFLCAVLEGRESLNCES